MKVIIKRNELINLLILTIVIMIINLYPLTINAAVSNVSYKVEKILVDKNIKEYNYDESEHFIYRYSNLDKEYVQMIKKDAEDSYNKIAYYFGYNIKSKVMIIIFNDTNSMNNALNLSNSQKSMGIYSCGIISILSPNAWIEDSNIEDVENIFKSSGPMVHELTHYFVDKKTKSNYPIWFTEGVALYFENIINGFEWGKGKNYKLDGYSLEQLTNNFENLNQDYAYRKSFEIIREYVDKNDINKLMNTMENLREGYLLEQFQN